MKNPVTKVTIQTMLLDGIFWATYCSFGSFVVPFLTDSGFSDTTATLILTLISVVSFAVQPLTGFLCDTRISERNLYILFAAVSIPLLLLLPSLTGNLPLLLTALFILTITLYQVPGLIDSLVIRMKQQYPSLNYGLPRGTGSLVFAINAQIMGALTVSYGHGARFLMGSILLAINIAVAFTLRQPGPAERPAASHSQRAPVSALFSNRTYMLLLGVTFLAMSGSACINSFLSILAAQLGGDSGTVGSALGVAALFEVPSMFFMNRILQKIPARRVILTGSFFYIFRLGAHLVAPDPASLIAIQVLQCLSFALLWPAAVNYINDIVSDSLKSTAIMTFSSVGLGISSIFGTALGTALLPIVNVTGVFAVCTGLTVLGFLLALYGGLRRWWI